MVQASQETYIELARGERQSGDVKDLKTESEAVELSVICDEGKTTYQI